MKRFVRWLGWSLALNMLLLFAASTIAMLDNTVSPGESELVGWLAIGLLVHVAVGAPLTDVSLGKRRRR
ncbi:hypothetical protein ABZ949_01900 [Micromonospora tulbaghiae]|uniref:hypothetical protein n=1 Tax=Micromonospora tulbaghiae TaxID=479978 RepID=UPI0033F9A8F8